MAKPPTIPANRSMALAIRDCGKDESCMEISRIDETNKTSRTLPAIRRTGCRASLAIAIHDVEQFRTENVLFALPDRLQSFDKRGLVDVIESHALGLQLFDQGNFVISNHLPLGIAPLDRRFLDDDLVLRRNLCPGHAGNRQARSA